MKLSSLLSKMINQLWLFVATLIIFSAVLLSLARALLPMVSYYQVEIEEFLSNKLDAHVTFESITAGWESEGPQFQIKSFNIQTSDRSLTPLTIELLRVRFDFWESIFQMRFATSEFELKDSLINIDLDNENFTLQGLPDTQDNYNSMDVFIDTLLGQNDVVINNIHLNFLKKSRSYSSIRLNELSIQNFSDIHQIEGSVLQENGGELYFISELFGDPRLPSSQAKLYLNTQKVDLAKIPLLPTMLSGKVETGLISGDIWAFWTSKGWQRAQLNISVEPLDFSIKTNRFSYKKLSSQLIWDKVNDQESQVLLTDLNAIDELDRDIQLAGLKVTLSGQPFSTIQLSYKNIEPGYLNTLWALMIDEKALQEWFLLANPQIVIEEFELIVEKQEDDWDITSGFLTVSDLTIQNTPESPGVSGLKGDIVFLGDQVNYSLLAQNTGLDYRPLFREVIPLKHLSLTGQFLSRKNQSSLTFDMVKIETPHAKVSSFGNLFFYQDSPPELSIYAEVYGANASGTSLYLPVGVMGQGLTNFLDTSIKSGFIDLGRFNFQAQLVPNLLDQKETTFEIVGSARNMVFEYLPGWPIMNSINAELFFDQKTMNVKASDIRKWNISVPEAIASIDDFNADDPQLNVRFRAITDKLSADKYIQQSPLNDIIGRVPSDFSVSGNLNVTASVNVGLESEKLSLMGEILLQDNAVTINTIDLPIERASGKLMFDTDGVSANGLTLNILNGSATANLKTIKKDGLKVIEIQTNGESDASQIMSWLLPDYAVPVSGSIDYNLNGWLCMEQCKTLLASFDISSLLNNTEINAHNRFKKELGVEWPLDVKLKVLNESVIVDLDLNHSLAKGFLDFNQSGKEPILDKAIFSVREEHANEAVDDKPHSNLIHPNLNQFADNDVFLSVDLYEVDLIPWVQTVVDIFKKENKGRSKDTRFRSRYFIHKLRIESLVISNVEVSGGFNASGLIEFDIASKSINGKVVLLENNDIDFRLTSVVVTEDMLVNEILAEEIDKSPTVNDKPVSSPIQSFEGWPRLIVNCLSCMVFGADLGQVTFSADSSLNEIKVIGQSEIKNVYTAPFELKWRIDSEGLHETIFSTLLNAKKIGALIKRWGKDVGLKDSSAKVSAKLAWDGMPFQFDLANIDGGAQIDLGKGYLSDLSDAKGRLISFFSLQSITRRLTLDFKDIYKDGFFYDSMKGDLSIDKGVISTNNLFIDGNVAEVEIFGSVNLADKTFNQFASVTPKVTSSLPVLAGWALEPTTGILVWLLNKIFEPAIDVITNIKYHVTGPWENPNVEELGKTTKEVEVTTDEYKSIENKRKKKE